MTMLYHVRRFLKLTPDDRIHPDYEIVAHPDMTHRELYHCAEAYLGRVIDADERDVWQRLSEYEGVLLMIKERPEANVHAKEFVAFCAGYVEAFKVARLFKSKRIAEELLRFSLLGMIEGRREAMEIMQAEGRVRE